jgi:hypothetical protein
MGQAHVSSAGLRTLSGSCGNPKLPCDAGESCYQHERGFLPNTTQSSNIISMSSLNVFQIYEDRYKHCRGTVSSMSFSGASMRAAFTPIRPFAIFSARNS